MVFGDGDEDVFTSFTKSLDVIAHELSHGVTEFTAVWYITNSPVRSTNRCPMFFVSR